MRVFKVSICDINCNIRFWLKLPFYYWPRGFLKEAKISYIDIKDYTCFLEILFLRVIYSGIKRWAVV
jgi:hypothetical protein